MKAKNEIVSEIYKAFKNVKLEDGIGLWEAQGYDDRLSTLECVKLRDKDETNDWKKVSLIDVYKCSSSISFFEAKGMRFHVPVFLLLALDVYKDEEDKLAAQGIIEHFCRPDIEDHLISISEYSTNEESTDYQKYYKESFSLLTNAQLNCIVKFLNYKMNELETYYKSSSAIELGLLPSAVKFDNSYVQLEIAVTYWKSKIIVS